MKMMNKHSFKRWLTMLLCAMLVCVYMTGSIAAGESTTPTDLEIVEEDESYWLDEVEGEVILDDPAYFMAEDGEEPAVDTGADVPSEEADDKATEDAAGGETPATPDTPTTEGEVDQTTGDDAAQQPSDTPSDTPADVPVGEPETPVEPEQPVEPETPPVDLKTLFEVKIKVPSTWRNSYSAPVRIKITPSSDVMWDKVKYRVGDEDWEELKDNVFLYDGFYYTDVDVYYNAKIVVRLFGAEGEYFDTKADINIFDHYAPEVTAGFKDMVLHVEAVDDLSQVAGIQVNGLLFTTLTDGKLDVRMEDPLLGYKQLAIRAYDYAGNFSDPVTLDNPYYVEPTPEPTNTPKPTKKPTTTKKPTNTKKPSSSSGSSSSGTSSKPTATPVVTEAPVVTTAPTQQIIYVTPDPNYFNYMQPTVTAEPETVYVPLGPGQPYKSEGNMQTLDMLYSASTNKQFITVQTRAGETYYMVIDYDKPIDEENEIYETYFLNLVDDRDLMSVVSEDEIQPTPTPQIVYVTPEPTEVPVQPTPIPVEDDEPAAPSSATLLLIVGIAAIAGAAFWFVKGKKNNAAPSMDDYEDEYEFEDEEDESDA